MTSIKLSYPFEGFATCWAVVAAAPGDGFTSAGVLPESRMELGGETNL